MIRSMTGFGQSCIDTEGYRIQVEIKSVNHRYAEVAVRLPREFLAWEDGIKREVLRVVRRGRIDVFVSVERKMSAAKTVELNWSLAEAYQEAAAQLREKFGLNGSLELSAMLQIPDLLVIREADEDASLLAEPLLACARKAASELALMREEEGQHLAHDLSLRLDQLQLLQERIRTAAPRVAEHYEARLRQRLAEWLTDGSLSADDPRLATEVAYMAERADITEELTRFASHLAQCRQLLTVEEPIGRKLDFLIQEMNREANTIGSKANFLDIVKDGVEMKAELEKLREQVQNIE